MSTAAVIERGIKSHVLMHASIPVYRHMRTGGRALRWMDGMDTGYNGTDAYPRIVYYSIQTIPNTQAHVYSVHTQHSQHSLTSNFQSRHPAGECLREPVSQPANL